jgi:hypothetical protein
MPKVDFLMDCVYNLADRVTSLEKLLMDLQTRPSLAEQQLDGAAKVTGSLVQPIASKLDLSEGQLIDIYNDIPHILQAYIMPASLTAESYREETGGKIFIEKNGTGIYWIIRDKLDHNWLVPNLSVKLNIHKVKTVQRLFNFTGDLSSDNREFILNKPAQVSLQQHDQLWKLEKMGELEFSNPSSEKKTFKNRDAKHLLSVLEESRQENLELRATMKEMSIRMKVLEEKIGK